MLHALASAICRSLWGGLFFSFQMLKLASNVRLRKLTSHWLSLDGDAV